MTPREKNRSNNKVVRNTHDPKQETSHFGPPETRVAEATPDGLGFKESVEATISTGRGT